MYCVCAVCMILGNVTSSFGLLSNQTRRIALITAAIDEKITVRWFVSTMVVTATPPAPAPGFNNNDDDDNHCSKSKLRKREEESIILKLIQLSHNRKEIHYVNIFMY